MVTVTVNVGVLCSQTGIMMMHHSCGVSVCLAGCLSVCGSLRSDLWHVPARACKPDTVWAIDCCGPWPPLRRCIPKGCFCRFTAASTGDKRDGVGKEEGEGEGERECEIKR